VWCSVAEAQAADDSTDRETLRGISAFHAVALVVAPEIPSASSIRASLQTQVELCLRRDGIEVVEGNKYAPAVVFFVNVLSAKSAGGAALGYAAAWDFEVRQYVRTLRGAGNYVATWHWGNIGVGGTDGLESMLTRNVEAGCASFSNAWFAVNPKSH